jgi:hypothetical protein
MIFFTARSHIRTPHRGCRRFADLGLRPLITRAAVRSPSFTQGSRSSVDGRDRRLAQSSGQYQVQRGRLKNEEQLETPETVIARYAAQISLWALWISGGALFVAVCAFILELRRRFDEGVRLSVNIMPRAKLFGGVQDANTYLSVIVTNRGSAPTTITHFLLFYYPNQLALYLPRWSGRWLKWLRPQPSFIANTGTPGPIPYFLEPGKTGLEWLPTRLTLNK